MSSRGVSVFGWIAALALFAAVNATEVKGAEPYQEEAKEKKIIVQPADLPEKISKAIQKAFPKGEILKIEMEVQGKDPGQYDVFLRADGKEYEVEVSPEGKIIEIDEKMPAKKRGGGKLMKKWTESFHMENRTFSSTGRNRFFILEPGYRLVLESSREKVVITVLDETKKIGDVETRVVEEREEKNGELEEVSRNFFAVCRETNDVFYFGEEVDMYEEGKVVKHSGEWRADEAYSKAGIIMPGTILLGARHYQEVSPNAMDRAEILKDDVTMKTPAGTFTDCLWVEETSGIDPDDIYYKMYAPGVGMIQDEDLQLTWYGKVK